MGEALFLPEGRTTGNLRDASSSFAHASFVVGYFPDIMVQLQLLDSFKCWCGWHSSVQPYIFRENENVSDKSCQQNALASSRFTGWTYRASTPLLLLPVCFLPFRAPKQLATVTKEPILCATGWPPQKRPGNWRIPLTSIPIWINPNPVVELVDFLFLRGATGWPLFDIFHSQAFWIKHPVVELDFFSFSWCKLSSPHFDPHFTSSTELLETFC